MAASLSLLASREGVRVSTTHSHSRGAARADTQSHLARLVHGAMSSDAAGRPEAKWAGDFSCSTCGRKRLIAAAFSKKQLGEALQGPVREHQVQAVRGVGGTKGARGGGRRAHDAEGGDRKWLAHGRRAIQRLTQRSVVLVGGDADVLVLQAFAPRRAPSRARRPSRATSGDAWSASPRRSRARRARRRPGATRSSRPRAPKALKEVEAKGGSALEVARGVRQGLGARGAEGHGAEAGGAWARARARRPVAARRPRGGGREEGVLVGVARDLSW